MTSAASVRAGRLGRWRRCGRWPPAARCSPPSPPAPRRRGGRCDPGPPAAGEVRRSTMRCCPGNADGQLELGGQARDLNVGEPELRGELAHQALGVLRTVAAGLGAARRGEEQGQGRVGVLGAARRGVAIELTLPGCASPGGGPRGARRSRPGPRAPRALAAPRHRGRCRPCQPTRIREAISAVDWPRCAARRGGSRPVARRGRGTRCRPQSAGSGRRRGRRGWWWRR